MKKSIKNMSLISALIAGLCWTPAGRVAAQTFTILYSFYFGADEPQAGLIVSGTTLYGTTAFGNDWDNGTVFKVNTDGSSGYGTVFAVKTKGSGFTNLHNFNGNTDGVGPYAGLTLSGQTL